MTERDWDVVVRTWQDYTIMATRDEWVLHNDAPNFRSQRLTDGKLWRSWLKYDKTYKPFNGNSAVQLSFANDLFLLLNQG